VVRPMMGIRAPNRSKRGQPATSCVAVSGAQVLSTVWKSTDGTAGYWKYVVDNVIVNRDPMRIARLLAVIESTFSSWLYD
jgi:hypothetical protein